jgi:hypothetical protein
MYGLYTEWHEVQEEKFRVPKDVMGGWFACTRLDEVVGPPMDTGGGRMIPRSTPVRSRLKTAGTAPR